MKCVYCESERVVKNGKGQLSAQIIQRYLCHECGRRFNERSGTPMARLRTAPETISLAMKVRGEGLGIRATGRVLGKSGGSIINWEKRLSEQATNWSPPAPEASEVTLEGDEVYTRLRENLPPPKSPKAGRFTLSSEPVAIGLRLKLDLKMHPSLRKASKPPGIGQSPVNGFDGLQMENDAMVNSCGN